MVRRNDRCSRTVLWPGRRLARDDDDALAAPAFQLDAAVDEAREQVAAFGYDGFSELWFDSEESLKASLSSPEGKTLLADLPNFTDSIHPLVVEDYLMLG
jgi:uncharacterized protein (TIGR02118 family)